MDIFKKHFYKVLFLRKTARDSLCLSLQRSDTAGAGCSLALSPASTPPLMLAVL